MSAIGLALLVLAGLLMYEAVKGISSGSQTAEAASVVGNSTASTPTSGASVTASTATGGPSGNRLLPEAFYHAIANYESGGVGYQYGNGIGFFGQSGQGTAGSHVFTNSGDPYGNVTPPLALYNNYSEAQAGLDSFLTNNGYLPYIQSAIQTGNLCAFLRGLASHGYSGPSGQEWATKVAAAVGVTC